MQCEIVEAQITKLILTLFALASLRQYFAESWCSPNSKSGWNNWLNERCSIRFVLCIINDSSSIILSEHSLCLHNRMFVYFAFCRPSFALVEFFTIVNNVQYDTFILFKLREEQYMHRGTKQFIKFDYSNKYTNSGACCMAYVSIYIAQKFKLI